MFGYSLVVLLLLAGVWREVLPWLEVLPLFDPLAESLVLLLRFVVALLLLLEFELLDDGVLLPLRGVAVLPDEGVELLPLLGVALLPLRGVAELSVDGVALLLGVESAFGLELRSRARSDALAGGALGSGLAG